MTTKIEGLRDRLLQTVKRRYTVKELDGVGPVRFQSLTEKDYGDIDKAEREGNDRAMLIAKSVVDDNGDRVFADTDIELIKSFDLAYINALALAATEHVRTIPRETIAKN